MTNIEEFDSSFKKEEGHPVNLKEIIGKYAFHWPIFILGIVICVSIAFIYLRYAQPFYLVNTTLLIKDENKGGMPAGGDLLNELDLFGSSKVVDNEIEILRSKSLMRRVVDRMNLSVSFDAKGRVKNSELYSNSPVNIGIVRMNSVWYGKTLDLSFPNSSTYILKDNETQKEIAGNLNELQRNELGIYKISKDSTFESFSNSSVRMTVNDPVVVADQFLSQLSVALASKQSTVLNLSIQSATPEKGQDILNNLIQVYNEAALADKNKTTQSTIEFIDERLMLITGELTDVEKDVELFKSTRGLTDLSNDASLFLENVQVNDAKLNEVNLQISVIKDIERYVNTNSVHEKLPSTLGINDPVLLGQVTQLGELQLKRDQLLETTTENNPVMAPLNRQIETTRAGIKNSIENIYKTLEVSKRDLERNSAEFEGSIKKVPGQERQLISIKRQQTIKESLYLYLLQKKEEAALSYASAVADSRTVDSAYYSKVPVSPRKQIVYLAGFLLGVFLPIGYLYGKDLLNDKVEGASNLASLTSAPLLGEIMHSEQADPIVVHENSRKAIAEQFRSIRTNMKYLHGKVLAGEGKVTLFTSGMSGEGKTFVSINLATALAISGKRTVLLELDLRKPKVSKYLSLPTSIGISNYLIGKAEIAEIIKETTVNPNLFVIGSGPIPPNPSELLIQPEIEVLIAYLRNNFDEIIIDTPPIGLVTDAQILGRLADSSIYLVREGVTYKEQIKRLDLLYKSQKLPKLNLILNGANSVSGYGYGYYSDDDQVHDFSFKTVLKSFWTRF